MKNKHEIPSGSSTMSSEIRNAHNYNSWIVSKIKPYIGNTVLEIGTGYGNFYDLIRPNCNKYFSVDIDMSSIEESRKQNPSGDYFLGDISDSSFSQSIEKIGIDTVICLNVLEHIETDKKALENMLQILVLQGHLIVFVPAFQFLYSSMDKFAGHYRRYTFSTFKKLIHNLGLECIIMEYCNPIGGIGWYINKFLNHQYLDSKSINSQIRIFDKYLMPVSIIVNPLSKRFFGQSLLFIGRKK